MKWYQKLYLGETIRPKADEVRQRMDEGEYPSGIWLIMPGANGKDLFDLRPAKDLRKQYFSDKEPEIIGMAKSKAEAVSLVGQIAAECLEKTGGTDIRSFIRSESECIFF